MRRGEELERFWERGEELKTEDSGVVEGVRCVGFGYLHLLHSCAYDLWKGNEKRWLVKQDSLYKVKQSSVAG